MSAFRITFEAALRMLRTLLAEEELSANICWVFHEDVAMYRGRYWIRYPIPESNLNAAKKLFYIGMHRGLGLRIHVLASLKKTTACHVIVPVDENDSDRLLTRRDGIRFAIPSPPEVAVATRNRFLWGFRKRRGDRWIHDVPKRRDLGDVDDLSELFTPSESKLLFVISGYDSVAPLGTIFLPGVQSNENSESDESVPGYRVGDAVELRCSDGSTRRSEILGMTLAPPTDGESSTNNLRIHFLDKFEPPELPIGTEVWIADSTSNITHQ